MKDTVSVDQIDDVKYKISITVSPENVEKKFDDFFESVRKSAQVPGFRKGRAPISRLKQYYHREAQPTVAQMLLTEYYSQAVKDNSIDPVGVPDVDEEFKNKYPGVFNADKSYSIGMTVEVMPNIEPQGYTDLTIDTPDYDDELLFNTKMNEYREKFAERRQIEDRGAELGDALVIDFVGSLNGEEFEGGAAEGFTIDKLGTAGLVPGFEEQIVGMFVGESKEITVMFPEDYSAEHLAGQETQFNITIHSIVEAKLAEIDDELALLSGFNDVDDMTSRIKNEIEQYKTENSRRMADAQIVEQLIQANQFSIPTSMVNDEKTRLMGGRQQDDLPDNVKQELETMAIRNVKRAILIDKIYEAEEDIEVTPETLGDALEAQAEQSGQTKDELVSLLYNNGQMDAFVGELRERNVIEFIMSKAKDKDD